MPQNEGAIGNIFVGTASWTDKTLLESGFYPAGATSAEARLRHYAENFSIVEVDSTYYYPPTKQAIDAWIKRTPSTFTFHIKAYSLLTGHPTRPNSIPKDLASSIQGDKRFLYAKDIGPEIVDECWRRFTDSLKPLYSSGKLGVVHLQFPEWFLPSNESREFILACRKRLGEFAMAVEFRNAAWLNERNASRTIDFLRKESIPFTSVDMPQGFASSMPPVAIATSKDLSYVRFHGRNTAAWKGKHETATPRFAYNYSQEELLEWAPKIKGLAQESKQVHVLMNNCYSDYAVNNARELAAFL